jgi:hypothetical protein
VELLLGAAITGQPTRRRRCIKDRLNLTYAVQRLRALTQICRSRAPEILFKIVSAPNVTPYMISIGP